MINGQLHPGIKAPAVKATVHASEMITPIDIDGMSGNGRI